MRKRTEYDVFVSYRRSSSESANLIATTLRSKGYRVFFDVESLRGGKFNEQLYDVIDSCTDFLLILPENALDRCNDPEDWVRKEVLRAMSGKKNIIPVMLTGFTWPSPMPHGMEGLDMYQALTATSHELFPESMERLSTRLMKSRRHRSVPAAARTALAVTLCFAVLSFGFFMLFRHLSVPLCDRVSETLMGHIGLVDDLGTEGKKLSDSWESFLDRIGYGNSLDYKYAVYREFMASLDEREKSVKSMLPSDTLGFGFDGYDAFLLSMRGMNASQLETSPSDVLAGFTNLLSTISSIRLVVTNGMMTGTNIRTVRNSLDMYPHTLKLLYFLHLGYLSSMPSDIMASCGELSRGFRFLPKVSEVANDDGMFGNALDNENATIDALMERYGILMREAESDSAYMDDRLSNLNTFLSSAANLENMRRANEAEIAAKKEKIAMMHAANDVRKQKLEEMDKELSAVYEDFKQQCSLEEGDGKWLKWGKIVKFASFMEDMVKRRKDMEQSTGVRSTSSISPDVLYAHLCTLLNSFKEYHPESAPMAESAKLFYKEVSEGKRPISGVIVGTVKDGENHPVFKVGDIIVKFKGVAVEDYNHMKTIFRSVDGGMSVVFLRAANGGLEECSSNDCSPVDIVGFNSLSKE